jgi:twinkle protein
MSTLTSIESVARKLDDARASRLKTVAVDFDSYLRAREADIGNIKTPNEFREDLLDEFFGDPRQHGLDLPWIKTRDKFLIRPAEVTIWTGFNGHMKSMCTGYVLLHLLSLGEKACIASFEMKPRKTLRLSLIHISEPTRQP